MAYYMYKVSFLEDIYNCNSIKNVCNHFISEEIYRRFISEQSIGYTHGIFALSDAFPFIKNELYISKPSLIIGEKKPLDIVSQKALRTIEYVEISRLDEYITGTYDYLSASKNTFGTSFQNNRVMSYRLKDNVGLYMIVKCDSKKVIEIFSCFLIKYIKEIIATAAIEIVEESFFSLCLRNALDNKSNYCISMSTLCTDICIKTLSALCDNSFYEIEEKALFDDKYNLCYIKPGGFFSTNGIEEYNSIKKPGCIGIGVNKQNYE